MSSGGFAQYPVPVAQNYQISELVTFPGQKPQIEQLNYSATEIFTEILGPLDQVTFISLGKIGTNTEFPVVKDGEGRTILKFATTTIQVQEYYRRYASTQNTVIVDLQQQILLEAKSQIENDSFHLVIRDGGKEKLVGTSNQKTCSCSLHYDMIAPRSGRAPEDGPIVMEAEGLTRNCWCSSTDSVQFKGYDPKVQGVYRPMGNLIRLPFDPLVAPGGQSQLVFDKDLPIVYKIWMLFMGWQIHDQNFVKGCCGTNGRRGARNFTCYWLIFGSVMCLLLLSVGVALCIVFISPSKKNNKN